MVRESEKVDEVVCKSEKVWNRCYNVFLLKTFFLSSCLPVGLFGPAICDAGNRGSVLTGVQGVSQQPTLTVAARGVP